jgi:hypothetical protein
MNDIDKTVRLGTYRTQGGGHASTYAHIHLKDGNLSIRGVEGPTQGGNCNGSAGQIVMSCCHQPIANHAPGWTPALVAKFFRIWGDWHLNDMRTGCKHQRALGWTYNAHHNPKTFKGDDCPECGYSIGAAWLHETLPVTVWEFLNKLPDADRQPAWV